MMILRRAACPSGLRPEPWVARLSLVLVVTVACASSLAGSTHGRVFSGTTAGRASDRKSACSSTGRRSPNKRRARTADKQSHNGNPEHDFRGGSLPASCLSNPS